MLLAIACLLCGWFAPAGAMTVLSDRELDEVSAGGIRTGQVGQGLGQQGQRPQPRTGWPQQPQQPQTAQALPLTARPEEQAGRPALLAVGQVQLAGQLQYRLQLARLAQQQARAVNLVNSFHSDVLGSNNIYAGQGGRNGLRLEQQGLIGQDQRQQGRLSSAVAGTSSSSRHWLESSDQMDQHTVFFVDQQQVTESIQQSSRAWQVAIDGSSRSPEQAINDYLPVYLLSPATAPGSPYFDLPKFEVKVFGTGGSLDYTGLTPVGLGYRIDSIHSQAGDLRLGTTLTYPYLNLGSLVTEGCFLGFCKEKSHPLGTIPNPVPQTSQTHTLPGLGLNFEEWNLGTGFAFAGQGSLAMTTPLHIKVDGTLAFRVRPWLSLTLDLSKITGKESDVWTKEAAVDLVNRDIDFTLLDMTIDPFRVEFNGVVQIMLAGASSGSDDELMQSSVSSYFHNHSRHENSSFTESGSSSYQQSSESFVWSGAQLSGGQAELLAMSEGQLQVCQGSEVLLLDQAQQSMRVLHSVNATGSVAANGFNLARQPALAPVASGQLSLSQQNSFNQLR